jgi:hypothetical protein
MRVRVEKESIFIRYRKGSENRIPSDLKVKITEFVNMLESSNESYEKIVHKFIKPISDGMGYGISIESTWFKLIDEVYGIFQSDTRIGKFNFDLLYQLLKILIKTDDIENIWNEARNFILENIGQFSMWDLSYAKIFSEERKIKRDENGKYIGLVEGEICEYIGVKTAEEEKFDFIMSTTLGEYGAIYQLMKFISLIFISEDFNNNYERYPKSLNILLPESDTNCWFLQWKWQLRRLYGYSKSGWRPNLNYCDPDWLVSDLIANYSDSILETYTTSIFDLPEETSITEYEKAFEGFQFQLAYALDTDLRIGNGVEKYFKFRDRYIRWINGTAYTRAIIVIPSNNLNATMEEENIANEFISALVWKTQLPIRKVFGAAAAKRFLPIVGSSKNLGGIIMDVNNLEYNDLEIDEREILALALYKEGINSTSIYYSVLNFYKIIELLFKGVKNDIIEWINSNKEFLTENGHEKRIKEIQQTGEDLGNYIYLSCRCAVAHAGQIDNTVSPDKNDDFKRINSDLYLIKELAKKIIKEGLLVK